MNNKKLITINIITLITFIIVVGIGLNKFKIVKTDRIDGKLASEQIEKKKDPFEMKEVALKKVTLQLKISTIALDLDDKEEKELMELKDIEGLEDLENLEDQEKTEVEKGFVNNNVETPGNLEKESHHNQQSNRGSANSKTSIPPLNDGNKNTNEDEDKDKDEDDQKEVEEQEKKEKEEDVKDENEAESEKESGEKENEDENQDIEKEDEPDQSDSGNEEEN